MLDGPTNFYKFKHNQKWLIIKLKYFKGQKRITVDMFSTDTNLETFSTDRIKKDHNKFDYVHTWSSQTNTSCRVIFRDGITKEERQIEVNWL